MKRRTFRILVEQLADEAPESCPAAACILRCLAGSMALGIEGDLAEHTMDWMIARLAIEKAECDRILAEQLGMAPVVPMDPNLN